MPSLRSLTVLSLCVALAACSKLTQENYAKLETGMTRVQVEQLLGKPTECSGALVISSCTWGDQTRFVSVQFASDRVVMYAGQGLQ
ncbi:outer membrane protein assembly factor BamE domain-containing protein [Pseudomonas alabamensis]|uniref:outer membrane protein assembly factor BamE domain-containing protein n=1 Tax=Pseudomonas alabamensis TaxID=3064349 RepID=UPI003F64B9A7